VVRHERGLRDLGRGVDPHIGAQPNESDDERVLPIAASIAI